MSLQVPGARSARRLGVVALWVCVSAVGAAGPAPAASPGEGLAPRRALQRADELFRADRLLAAEGLYRRVLADAVGANRRHCLDRLLAIYARVGRQDLAIRLGLRYEQLLRRDGEAARARELALGVGGCYLTLGHAAEAEAPLRRALADDRGPALPPARRVAALTYLALAVERQGGHDRAVVAWQQAEAFARAQLDGPAARKLDGRQRLAIVRGLATSYRHLKQPRKAIARLEPLLALHDERKEPTEKRDTLQQLAGHLLAADRLEEAEQCLREALALHARHGGGDRMTRGDLAVELARVLQRRNRREASDWLERAAADYQAVRKHGTGFAESGEALRALWKLQELYQRTSQYDRALGLVGPGLEEGPGGFLIRPRLQAERGGLRVVLGQFVESRPLLRDAVAELEKQSPPNLVELPRVLLNLAAAELASDGRGLGAAVKLGTRCLDLYRSYGLPDDLVLVEAHNLLGTCAAQNGEYAVAVKHFRAGLARCPGLGAPAAPYRSNLLLNLALLYKAQGSLAEALKACEEARAVYAGFAEPDSLGLAAFDAARAGMLAARHQLKEANELSAEVLRRCARHKQSEQVLLMTAPLVVTARHCRALYQLWCRDFAGAERTWEEVRKLQGDRSPLLPRTLNYLALTREGLTQLPQAEALYRQAREVQRENPRAFPVTHFTTLWRLADVVDRQGRSKEARGLLREALAVVERARRQIYGDAEQRATFFAQFAPGYEQLIDWCVRDGELEEAVAVATRGRSRTLLDQLQMAGVDPREGLRGPEGEKLRREEAELRRKIAGLRARAQLVPAEALGEAGVQKLQAEFDRAQRRYSEVYREILNASEVYRGLGEQEFSGAALARLRERALGPRKLMLLYYVGRQRGYLLLLGDRSRPVEAFPLTVPEVVARRVAPPKAMALALAGVRGLSLKAKGKGRRVQPELPRPALPGQAVPLGQAVLRALVNNYLEQIRDPDFQPTRGLVLRSREVARPLPPQRPELLAEVLLPAPVRRRIRELAPECLVVVPDGALHKLPFEALPLRSGKDPAYVLDEFPPLVYAPSVAILSLLAERPAAGRTALSLLTVADPAYPEVRPAAATSGVSGLGEVSTLWAQLPRLAATAVESKQIAGLFRGRPVKALVQKAATKKAVTAALPGRRVVHLAAHGLADERFGNKFGALALTPSGGGDAAPEDDGFLSLHEICTLPLKGCELAVLSACDTNLGPQPPLEAGVTLASGFLAAGARRVVASHWSVADESTAELMVAFFTDLTAAKHEGRSAAYAKALRQARLKVRAREKTSSPFYWAPFVLIGPAD